MIAGIGRRNILLMVLSIVSISLLFSAMLLVIKEQLEQEAFEAMVRDEVRSHLINGRPDSVRHPLVDDARMQLYFNDRILVAPAPIQALGPGNHHSVAYAGREWQVQRDQIGETPYLVMRDITEWEERENLVVFFFAVGAVLIALVAVFVGLRVTALVLKPLDRLTRDVRELRAEEIPQGVASDYGDAQVSALAGTVNELLLRVRQFVEREREFAATASHELKTPVAVVLGAAEVMQKRGVGERNERTLARIHRAGIDMKLYTEALLTLIREQPESGESEAVSSIHDVFLQAQEDLEEYARESLTGVRFDGDRDRAARLPDVYLKLILGNLLRNAIEHSPGGTVRVFVDADSLSVSDDGDGMTDEVVNRVLDKGFTTRQQGTGLGLALVKRVCDRFDVEIHISSNAGAGTQVRLEI